ncbi:S1C family serine protease [Crateriforma conspicua]|uniref:Putative serine protease HhoA n=1 Tax=Crateriforma conspicua TaxID=2527996 RepID=A0A5C5Y3I5_9PLAN|nr:S1C family serine protease [Crateriforma conspicua]QDV64108.1 Putative serine protease HhoA precursor [Crateriforma conspicua]TWT69498.1 putative serine protease HhoA precursor [Crateriforma conspicua]
MITRKHNDRINIGTSTATIGMRGMACVAFALSLMFAWSASPSNAQPPTMHDLAREAQKRVVKIYGAGGKRGLEAYQSGFLVSPFGHVATAWSYVLDVEPIVVTDDGRRFDSKIVGFQPALELAVLKIDVDGLDYFPLPGTGDEPDESTTWIEPAIGDPVLAVSNLFGVATGNEPASVMQGTIAAIARLDAGRGNFKTPYRGKVFVLDLIANNPGAAGGALVAPDGRLVAMLGKELRDSETGVWLNYAIPISVIKTAVDDIVAGRESVVPDESDPILDRDRSHNLETLGLVLVPDVLEKTPAFVDEVIAKSPGAKSELRPDDLLLMINGRRIDGQASLKDQLRRIDRRDKVQLTIQRGTRIIPVTIQP